MATLFGRRSVVMPWQRPRRVVTVWGPTGSPGRSTLAAALAGALVPAGRVVLVDADCLRGALGPLLGVSDGGTIVSAATMPAPSGKPCRPRDLHLHRAGFWLIRGVPGPMQEVALAPDDIATLLGRLRRAFDLVVVDVGAALPPREYGDIHLAALKAADLVLVLGALTPLGLSDLLLQARVFIERLDPAGLSLDGGNLAGAGPQAWCVLNKGQGRLLRHGPERVSAETGLPVVSILPYDPRNVLAAEDARLPLTVARPRSPSARVVSRLSVRLRGFLSELPRRAAVDGRRRRWRT